MKSKIRSFDILTFFCVIYPVCPGYFYIAGIQVKNIIAFSCFALILLLSRGSIVNRVPIKYGFPILLYVICTGFSQLIHAEFMSLASQIVLWIGIVTLSAKLIDTKEKFFKIIDVLIFTAGIVGIFGFIEEITHFNVFSILNTAGSILNYNPLRFGILRIISFTSHAITYCTYCMLIFGMILFRVGTVEQKRRSAFYLVGSIVLLNAILTLSRISLLGILVETILFLWFSGKRKFFGKILKYTITIAIIIGIACIVSSSVKRIVELASYVVLALFDDSYVTLLRANGFTDNAAGVGNRLDLYNWVFAELKGNFLLGRGASSSFSHIFVNHDGYRQVKESIEVEWLRTLYRYGIVGLFGQVYFMLSIAITFYKDKIQDEKKITFGRALFSMVFAYMIVFFGVMQNQDIQLFAIIVMLFLAYKQLNRTGLRKII